MRRDTDKRNRRQSGQQQYRGPDRRGSKDQRRGFQKRNDSTSELLPEVKTLLETISENQKQLIQNEDRKMLVLENIAASLRLMSGNTEAIESLGKTAPGVPAAAEPKKTDEAPGQEAQADEPEAVAPAEEEDKSKTVKAAAEDKKGTGEPPARSTKEEIRKIALELREQGKTYKEIAKYLDDEKIPTFSGKGGWHAPTIHKLCK